MSFWSDFVDRFNNEYPYTDYQKINLDWLLDGMKACIEAVGGFIQQYNPVTKTPSMTQPVGKDSSGKLWTAPGGGGGGAVESVNGKTGVVVLTASDVGAGTYSKPSGGIPKTDLASAVQTSLGKADTALQSAPVTSVNSKTGAVVLTASDVGAGTYSKPSGGIPKTDLASAVQTSLGKADTALQSAPVTSVNSKTGAVVLTASDVGSQAAPIVVTQSAPTAITLADNTVYYLSGVTSLTISYPASGHWECLIVLTTASSGTVTITLPTSTYIGSVPSFGNRQTWEISIRDSVVVAGKAGA